MSQLSAREILDAIRRLSDEERQALIDERISGELSESPEEITAIREGLGQAERGQLINHEDLANYMSTRRKEHRRA